MATLPPIHRWNDVSQPRASVHIVHGMAEHGARYGRFAGALNRAGFNVWAHDQRGHGLNPMPGQLGHFGDDGGWRALIDDAWVVSAEMLVKYPGVPLILFAHSMGSFVGQTLMGQRGAAYRGVLLCGTNGSPNLQEGLARLTARVQRRVLGARSPGAWLERLVLDNYNRRFAPNRTKFDWLSRDLKEVDKYRDDPLCGFPLSAQAWLDFLAAKPLLGTDEHLQKIPKALPVRVIAGTHDPVGEESKGVDRLLGMYTTAGMTKVSHRFYEAARHELVNETNRDDVTHDVIAWIDDVIRT
jgi:alpha-beta hydrolase superfamily lysophospholipase